MTSTPCPRCHHNHASDDARAIGRFTPAPQYVAKTAGTPPRATRAEAEADECAARQKRRTEAPVETRAAVAPMPTHEPRPEPAPFPAATVETAARAKAWRDFLTQLRLSLVVWEIDGEVRTNCEPVLAWLNRCRDELNKLGAVA